MRHLRQSLRNRHGDDNFECDSGAYWVVKTNDLVHPYSATPSLPLVEKKKDPRAVIISCSIRPFNVKQALCDLGSRVNVMPLAVYKLLRMGELKPMTIKLLMTNSSMKKLMGIFCYVKVRVASLKFPIDFMVLDCEVNSQAPIILGRPFLSISRVLIDMDLGEITFKLNDEQVVFNMCVTVQQPDDIRVVSVIDTIDEDIAIEASVPNAPGVDERCVADRFA
ncbi:hypothetical protein P3L10_032644 [Capsicum annuum]|uniref:uncharacterized protein LOC124889694 n=1 Tax=Capsicum annuum TaxID=4072 RepID=UPI001FB05848|nr:uncharacterized protein LOC124889694 [Capsicum annuum]